MFHKESQTARILSRITFRVLIPLLLAGLGLWLGSRFLAVPSSQVVRAANNPVDNDDAIKVTKPNAPEKTGTATGLYKAEHLVQSHEEMSLDYLYRYDCHCSEGREGLDHLVTAVELSSTRAIVAGTPGITLLDTDVSPGDTITFTDRITTHHVRNMYVKGNYIFANIHGNGKMQDYGFSVFRTNGEKLQHVTTVTEPDVFYEKMDIVGDYLFVAAHADGIRVFDISDPTNPVLTGTLSTGFTDAWAIEIADKKAFVADGPAGLKVVNVTDPNNPVLITGETLTTAVGTSEAVTVRGNKVYVAAGAAGVAVYTMGDLGSRELIETGGVPEDFAWIGDHLAVSIVGGVVILKTDEAGETKIVARESSARRGGDAVLRLAGGLGVAKGNQLMVANWNYLDFYELITATNSTQPDIVVSEQRIRFPPAGGTRTITLTNNGHAPLVISHTQASTTSFTTDFYSDTLAPGASASCQITYTGGPGQGKIEFTSNDPDENPLAIQVYGKTDYLDPGEKAKNFTLHLLRQDSESGAYISETFTLSTYKGNVIWFGVYASW